ncbi:MAG: biotin attachment protein [Cellvibrionales bacterium TMED148]|nr:biotin attachment protein [Porticoccaceae bacterium]RPG89087.1 MAG: biotin attachment protein [Cellvibrionales bacterium TMED148]
MKRITVKIPQMGLTTEEVTLDEWLVSEGDSVTAGEVLANLQADKAIIELEAPSGGTVSELLVPADEEELLEIGTSVAILDC